MVWMVVNTLHTTSCPILYGMLWTGSFSIREAARRLNGTPTKETRNYGLQQRTRNWPARRHCIAAWLWPPISLRQPSQLLCREPKGAVRAGRMKRIALGLCRQQGALVPPQQPRERTYLECAFPWGGNPPRAATFGLPYLFRSLPQPTCGWKGLQIIRSGRSQAPKYRLQFESDKV